MDTSALIEELVALSPVQTGYLSSTQRKIRLLLISGRSHNEICQLINMPVSTVELHIKRIYKKSRIHTI